MATEQLPIKITHFDRKAEAPKTVFPKMIFNFFFVCVGGR